MLFQSFCNNPNSETNSPSRRYRDGEELGSRYLPFKPGLAAESEVKKNVNRILYS